MMKVSIAGATSYTGRELISILLNHPAVKIVHLGGRREERPEISRIFPALAGRCELRVGGLRPEDAPEKPDVTFFALPHGISQKYVPSYLDAGIRCIDFSGDYRLKDLDAYSRYYGTHENPQNLGRAVYGIPELFRKQIRNAELVANPGCYPTSVLLALAPLVGGGHILPDSIIIDAKSGVSGRGNALKTGSLYCECNENLTAYAIGTHRHVPEMEQGLDFLGATGAKVIFVPHLVPMDRGMLSTIYVELTASADTKKLRKIFSDYYSHELFIRIMRPGEQPRTKDVMNTNFCDLAIEAAGNRKAIITSAIDNLTRGAASQAVQNMNIATGIDEKTGLT